MTKLDLTTRKKIINEISKFRNFEISKQFEEAATTDVGKMMERREKTKPATFMGENCS